MASLSSSSSSSLFSSLKFRLLALIFIAFLVAHNISFLAVPSTSTEEMEFQIYSHNIRYDNKNARGTEKPWNLRKAPVTESIKFNAFGVATVVCLQEVLKNQLDDILELLNAGLDDPDWLYVGVGRNDGKEAGEYAPVLYRKSDFELLDSSWFWLSETPEVPSRGWDADQVRIATRTHLKHKLTGKKVNVFSTHLDHLGRVSREESVKLIAHRATVYNDDVSFIAGDFNSEPDEEAYQTLKKYLRDTSAHTNALYGYRDTFTGFNAGDREKVIDYIFVDDRLDNAELFGVLENNFSFFSSDHRPLLAKFLV